MSGYTVRRNMSGPGWVVVDVNGIPIEPYHHGVSYTDAKTNADELNAPPPRVKRKRYTHPLTGKPSTRERSTVGDCDGRNFDNLGESYD